MASPSSCITRQTFDKASWRVPQNNITQLAWRYHIQQPAWAILRILKVAQIYEPLKKIGWLIAIPMLDDNDPH